MADTVTDILETRLTLEGEREYRRGIDSAARSLSGFARAGDDLASSGIGRGLLDAAAAAALAAGAIGFLGRAALAAGEDAAAFGRAAGNFKGAFPADEIAEFTGELQKLTGVADDSIADFIGLLGTFRLTADQAKSLSLPILNAAEALKKQGVSATDLAVQLGKAFQTGSASGLRRAGIIIDEVGFKSLDSAGRVKALAEALQSQGGDAAIAFRRTLPGAVQALQVSIGSLQEALGESLVGPLTKAADFASRLADVIAGAPKPVKELATGIAVLLVGALTAFTVRATVAAVEIGKLAAEYLKLATAANAAAAATQRAGASLPGPGGAAGKSPGGRGGKFGRAAAGVGLFGLGAFLESTQGGALAQIGGRAAEGAGIGMFGGPKGAAIGGAIGALVGIFESIFSKKTPAQGDFNSDQKRVVELLEEQNRLIKEGRAPLGTGSGFSVADQYMAQQLVRMTGG